MIVGVGPVSPLDVARVARGGARVELSAEAQQAVAATRGRIESLAEEPKPVYGISTGLGALTTRHIPVELGQQLQKGPVRSHAAGTGPEVEREAR